MKTRKELEKQLQGAIIKLVDDNKDKHFSLRWLHCSLNGFKLHGGQIPLAVAQGLIAGIPDLCLPFPSNGYHGLYIEVKSPIGRLEPEQKEFRAHCEKVNYRFEVVKNIDEMKALLNDYLNIKI